MKEDSTAFDAAAWTGSELLQLRSVALDTALAPGAAGSQEQLAQCILALLERGYRLCLFSSAAEHSIAEEDFQHPQLHWLPMPEGCHAAVLRQRTELQGRQCLWVTNHPAWSARALECGGLLVHVGSQLPPQQPHHSTAAGAVQRPFRLGNLWELAALLDPTAWVLDQGCTCVEAQRKKTPGPVLVGVGGPPASRYAEFAALLQQRLAESTLPLAEWLDLSPILPSAESILAERANPLAWRHPPSGAWLLDEVLTPLQRQGQVFIPQRPPQLHPRLALEFPLFLSVESVLILCGEMVLAPMLADRLTVRVLLELSPVELTRRLYELPQDEAFDSRFTQRYLQNEGRVYRQHQEQALRQQAPDLRVDANHPQNFRPCL